MFVRSAEFIIDSIILIFSFRYLFQLKRVEIQMNEKNTTVGKTIKALKRQMWLEKIALAFYFLSIFIFMGLVLLIGYSMSIGYNVLKNFESITSYVIFLVVFSTIFFLEVFTILYFIKMAGNFMVILSEYYELKFGRLKAAVYFISLWVILTNARVELFTPIIYLFSFATN